MGDPLSITITLNGTMTSLSIHILWKSRIRGTYTWSNRRSNDDVICEKLDRVLTSLEWSFLFPRAVVIVEAAIASEHAPILLLTNGIEKRAKKDFKFESKWLLEDECPKIVKEEWEDRRDRQYRGTFRVKIEKNQSEP
ncbi:hypothetical protein V6N11_057054 [Hibiscus sabdariffa]|uniref:Uncharacterized protein n=2 Tax=Hibiscus sabdariffa TaxID=183260 RepID=A0ABR2CGV1_9ROSI